MTKVTPYDTGHSYFALKIFVLYKCALQSPRILYKMYTKSHDFHHSFLYVYITSFFLYCKLYNFYKMNNSTKNYLFNPKKNQFFLLIIYSFSYKHSKKIVTIPNSTYKKLLLRLFHINVVLYLSTFSGPRTIIFLSVPKPYSNETRKTEYRQKDACFQARCKIT